MSQIRKIKKPSKGTIKLTSVAFEGMKMCNVFTHDTFIKKRIILAPKRKFFSKVMMFRKGTKKPFSKLSKIRI